MFEEIYKAAFEDEFEKISGVRSDIAGQVLNPINWVIGAPSAVIGALSNPYTKKKMKKVNKQRVRSVLIPGKAPFRLGRRLGTAMSGGPK